MGKKNNPFTEDDYELAREVLEYMRDWYEANEPHAHKNVAALEEVLNNESFDAGDY